MNYPISRPPYRLRPPEDVRLLPVLPRVDPLLRGVVFVVRLGVRVRVDLPIEPDR
jgi:hypothetical protein